MNWPIWLFALVMVGLVAGYIWTRSALALPLAALTVYLAVDFSVVAGDKEQETLWEVAKFSFWVLLGLAVLAFFIQRAGLLFFVGAFAIAAMVIPTTFAFADYHTDWEENEVSAHAVSPPSTTTSTTIPAEDMGLTDEDTQQVADDLDEIYQDFEPGEVNVGTGNIPDSPEERAVNVSFTKETIETREDLCTFFASDHPKAADARSRVEKALRTAEYGDEEVHEALDASCARWIWVSPNVEHQILGTTYSLNGDIVKSENWRQVAPNDAIWFYVTTDAHIVAGASVRADCGNPEVDKVRPVRPETPTTPPIDVPPSENCPFPGKENLPVDSPLCLQPKDPSKDVLLNPDVPAQVRGPGTTPVGTDPGPATPACDTPTGYCPGSEPTTTTTTQPSGGTGGSGSSGSTTTTPTTVPSCGQTGQPSCENTEESPPTTEAPPQAPPTTESPTTVVTSP